MNKSDTSTRRPKGGKPVKQKPARRRTKSAVPAKAPSPVKTGWASTKFHFLSSCSYAVSILTTIGMHCVDMMHRAVEGTPAGIISALLMLYMVAVTILWESSPFFRAWGFMLATLAAILFLFARNMHKAAERLSKFVGH